MSFCVAGVALCDIPTCFKTRQTSFFCVAGRNTFATFSEDALHFSWQVQHFGHLRCILRGRRSTSDVACCVFFVNRIVSAARSGDKGENSVARMAFCHN